MNFQFSTLDRGRLGPPIVNSQRSKRRRPDRLAILTSQPGKQFLRPGARHELALWFQHHLAELLALFEPALRLSRRLEWEHAIDDRRQLTGEEELGRLQ